MNAHTLLNDVIRTGQSSSADALLQRFGQRLTDPVRDELAGVLQSPTQEMRISGVVRLLLNICYGADTQAGAILAAAAMDILADQWRSFKFENPAHLENLCVATLTACIHAHYEEGLWDACPGLLSRAKTFSFAESRESYWNGPALLARMFLANNRVSEAKQLLDRAPIDETPQTTQVGLARRELATFVGKRLELEERPLTVKQAKVVTNVRVKV